MRFEYPDGSFKISLGGAMSIVLIGYGDIAKERLNKFCKKTPAWTDVMRTININAFTP